MSAQDSDVERGRAQLSAGRSDAGRTPDALAVDVGRLVLLVATVLALGLTLFWDHGAYGHSRNDAVSGWASILHAYPKDAPSVILALVPLLVLVLAISSGLLVRRRKTLVALQAGSFLVLLVATVAANSSALDAKHDALYHATGGGVGILVLALLSAGWLVLALAPHLVSGGDA